MLRRKYSLNSQGAIFYVLKKGRNIETKYFLIKIAPNSNNTFRQLISVGKKDFKLAVTRNLVKRRVRHILYTNKVHENKFFLFIKPKKKILEASFQDIEQDFLKGYETYKTRS